MITTLTSPISDALNRLVWIDLEMTGLNPDSDKIIEIAIVVTDADLDVVATSETVAIFQSDAVLDAMDAWNQATHKRTGLIDRVKTSDCSEVDAEARMIDFLKAHVAERASPMCGNSICQDRRFLARHMPRLEAYFHYRNLDVSTLKELARRWFPAVAKGFQKRSAHSALADILESIDELRYYRKCFFADPAPPSEH